MWIKYIINQIQISGHGNIYKKCTCVHEDNGDCRNTENAIQQGMF